MPSDAVLYQAAALCLTYPDDDFRARLPLLREAAPQLREFVDHAAVTPAPELAAHYVRVFDVGNRHGLYLSRWQNGMSAARFKEVYRAAGLEFAGAELPDFLPSVLEFTARTGDLGPLTEHRDGLGQLRSGLGDLGTPYASVLDAVCATLPAGGRP
ncbi:nitrate reductase molybdenum cofactor assembly chaperone [Streptomyces sp. NPDC005374]|uniref:nitrate reductase molybdenum cofactor assembly chaperone n=1 Tax=Streptomyces sp. NPDC005374 TaxID=3364713 RepID=UPI00368A8CB1